MRELLLMLTVFAIVACNPKQTKEKENKQEDQFKPSTNFVIDKLTKNEFAYIEYLDGKFEYKISGTIINNTDRNITSASLDISVSVAFEEKTIVLKPSNEFYHGVFLEIPDVWRPNEKLNFEYYTNEIDDIYLEYPIKSAQISIVIEAEDPMGYKYHETINVYDILPKWQELAK